TDVVPYDIASTTAKTAAVSVSSPRTLRGRLQRWTWSLALAAPARWTRLVLVESSLSAADETRLQIAMGQLPTLRAANVDIPAARFDIGLRSLLDCGSW